jgi:tetratricopeptide (TPR) repeat protein
LVSFLLTLADLQRALDDHAGAEQSYLEGLRWSEDAGEPVGLEQARLQAGLGSLYDFTGRESEAAPLYAAAIATLDALGPDGQLEAAYLHNNLAMILKGDGDFPAAERHYRAALKAFQEGLGLASSTVATVLNNLGGLYTFMSRTEEAAEMHQKALEIRQEGDGRNTPDQAQSMTNLAAVFHREGDFARARRYYEQARHLFERDLRGVEADYAIAMRNFAALYREHGDENQALATESAARARLGDRWED